MNNTIGEVMLAKRNFMIEFCREEKGVKLYSINDEAGDVFVDRIFDGRNAEAVLRLVKQAYEQGLKDMAEHIQSATKI